MPYIAFDTPSMARSRLALAARNGRPPEELAELKRDLAASNIAAAIKRALAVAPPLTEQQADNLAAILQGTDAATAPPLAEEMVNPLTAEQVGDLASFLYGTDQ